MAKYLYTILILLLFSNCLSQNVKINEVLSKNDNSITDIDGEYKDWIELYNPNQAGVVLQGCFLTNDFNDPTKWQIPNISIPPGSHKIIFASGKNLYQPQLHSNFTLSSSGSSVWLLDNNLNILDSITIPSLASDLSYCRKIDGGSQWGITLYATPNDPNIFLPEPNFVNNYSTGFYADTAIFILTSDSSYDVKYSLDFSEPISQSPNFVSPILFTEPISQNNFSNIQSSVVFSPPIDTIKKINVIKYRAFNGGIGISDINTNSFLINLDYSLPVISITTNSQNLFNSDSGFYVPGDNPGNAPWHTNANFYQKNREVIAHFEYFKDGNLEVSHPIGLKLHGGLTRNYSQKSLKLVARSEYGKNEFTYPFFQDETLDEFDRLILRNGGQDISRAIIRDAFIHKTVKSLNILTMNVQPTILFLNGEYWGIHNLRDKIDEHYLENKLGIDKDSVDLLQGNADIIEGDNQEYLALINYVNSNDLSDSLHYNYVKNKINIDNFIDYFLVEIYYNNREWPHNNIKYYKQKGNNYKWNWVLFDLDISASAWSACKADKDSYVWLADTNGYPVWSRTLFLNLSNNIEFKNKFANRFADIKNTVLKKSNQLNNLNDLKNEIEPEIDEHLRRWSHIPSKADWLNRLGVVEVFINQRDDYIWNQTIDFFDLGDTTVDVSLDQNISGAGELTFSTLTHQNFPWEGRYYKNTYIKLTANANPGYEFSHWLETGSTDDQLLVTLTSDTSFTAVYSQVSNQISGLQINEILASNSNDLKDNLNECEDMIELFNSGNNVVDLNELYLTDNSSIKTKHKLNFMDSLKRFLMPQEKVILYADKDTSQGFDHLNFSLSNSGEFIGLYQRFGTDTLTIDTLTYGPRIENVSFGRYPDGSPNFRNFSVPTFGNANFIKPLQIGLKINEVLSNNVNDTIDGDGENEDWIELFNASNNLIELGGYFLSDDVNEPLKHKLSSLDYNNFTLSPNSFELFFADKDIDQGKFHLDFKISSQGESVYISYLNNDSIIQIDEIIIPSLNTDSSYGCIPDGGIDKFVFENTTPKYSNVIYDNINKNKGILIDVYPNPADEKIYVVLDGNIESIDLYDYSGRLVQNINSFGKKEVTINTTKLEPGVYIMVSNWFSKKIVIQKRE